MERKNTHQPVLLEESIQGLNIRPDGVYVDGTLGRAGHSLEIVRRLGANGRLICIDRDAAALEAAQDRLSDYMDRVTLVHGNFGDLADLLDKQDMNGADGMLFDLGVSSPQLDDFSRGFSYQNDAPLDMRMDRSQQLTARTIVNRGRRRSSGAFFISTARSATQPSVAAVISREGTENP
jgi:16S rRNA (cytosine1402-N4)-methyltransferase